MSRPSRKWDVIIEFDHEEEGCSRMDCIGVCQDRDIGSLGRKSPLSRPRRKWDDIIEIDSHEVGCGNMDCIGLCQVREIGNLGERYH